MPRHDRPDIVTAPVEIARQMYNAQLEAFRKSHGESDNPVRDWAKQHGYRLKDVNGNPR